MMIILKPFAIFILIAMLNSCTAQNDKILNLEKMDSNFNVANFYKDKISPEFYTDETDDFKETLITEQYIILDTLAYYNDDYDYYDGDVHIDNTKGWMGNKNLFRDENSDAIKLFGYEYYTIAWTPKDSVAFLADVYFSTLNMTETENGNFAYLDAYKSSRTLAEYNKIKSYLEQQYGEAKIIETPFDENIISFENDEYIFRLSQDEKDNFIDIHFMMASKKILIELKENGVESFKRIPIEKL